MSNSTTISPRPGRDLRVVEQFLHDELLESLPSHYDRAALLQAEMATYVIHQTVTYDYSRPVRDLSQRLVILPRFRHGDQRRAAYRFDVRTHGDDMVGAARVATRADRFGNTVVHANVPAIEQTIEFRTRAVLVRAPAVARAAPWTSTAPSITRMTNPDAAIEAAARSVERVRDVFETADAISDLVRSSFEYAHDVTTVRTTAAQAWQLRRGVCQDMAHVMIAMCSTLGICARYVSGHLLGDGASHAWVEVYDPNRQQVVAIDPTHRRRTDLRYVTTAVGRDYRDVAPTSGSYHGHGSHGTLHVDKRIRLAELG